MTRNVESALATHYDQFEIRQQLHDVPPHAVYEVVVDGQRAVCKVARGETVAVGAEAAVVDHVDRRTDVPVPSILAADADSYVATWVDGLPGEDEVPQPDEIPNDYARAMGATMGRLHEATADQFPRPGVPRFSDDTPEEGGFLTVETSEDWHAVARAFLTELRNRLADIGRADPADEVLGLLDDRPDLFEGAGRPVLCHGNVFPEHVAFERDDAGEPVERDGGDVPGQRGEPAKPRHPGALTALVDFEHALVAPAEYDYWRTAFPVFHARDLDPQPTCSAFREGYESVQSLPLGVERRREAWLLVITVTYFLALDVQNRGIGPDEREQAEGMAGWVTDTVESLRARNG